MYGYANSAASTAGVYGLGDGNSGYGVYGQATTNYGVYGSTGGTNSNNTITAAGIFGTGSSTTAVGVVGSVTSNNPAIYGTNSGNGMGLYGQSSTAHGVLGVANGAGGAGVYGSNTAGGPGVIGVGNSTQSPTGYFRNDTSGAGTGLQGQCNTGTGVVGNGGTGVYGTTTVSGGNAGYFAGNVQVTGTISGAAKNFKIDHPLDPANKYLVHSCIESSEMINLYRGNVTLDSDGQAIVEMPTWFEAENTEFSYQLTAIGSAAPDLHVAREIDHNRFAVAGGKPGLKVSWQVTGTRQDAYARSHPLQVEQEKTGGEKGKYLDPVDYGKTAGEGIGALPLKTSRSVVVPLKSATGKFALTQPSLTVTLPKPLKVTPRRMPKTPSLRNAR